MPRVRRPPPPPAGRLPGGKTAASSTRPANSGGSSRLTRQEHNGRYRNGQWRPVSDTAWRCGERSAMPYYRSVGEDAAQAPHPVPPARWQPLRRGADGRQEGFSSDSSLLYHRKLPTAIVAARGVRRTRLAAPAQPPAQAAAPADPQARRGRRDPVLGRQHLLANDDVRMSYVVADRPSPLYRNAIGDECLYVESRLEQSSRSTFGALTVGTGDYVDHPHVDDAPVVPRRRAAAAAGDRGDRAHRPAAALPVEERGQFLEHSPYCERDLRGPAEPFTAEGEDVEVLVQHRGAAGTAWTYATRTTRSTSSAGTAASTPRRSPSTTSSRSPGGCTSRRRCTRRSRVRTS